VTSRRADGSTTNPRISRSAPRRLSDREPFYPDMREIFGPIRNRAAAPVERDGSISHFAGIACRLALRLSTRAPVAALPAASLDLPYRAPVSISAFRHGASPREHERCSGAPNLAFGSKWPPSTQIDHSSPIVRRFESRARLSARQIELGIRSRSGHSPTHHSASPVDLMSTISKTAAFGAGRAVVPASRYGRSSNATSRARGRRDHPIGAP